jgi:hypothetical protein
MVRLVFRPYTQVRPLICTLKPLRASTRVSSGFALLRHSSPSFGSQHMRSHSATHGGRLLHTGLTFIAPKNFTTLRLAHMLDSLVRVSRRVGRFGSHRTGPAPTPAHAALPPRPRHPGLTLLGRRGRLVVALSGTAQRTFTFTPGQNETARAAITLLRATCAARRQPAPEPLSAQDARRVHPSCDRLICSALSRTTTLRLSQYQRFHVLLSPSFQSAFHLSLTVLVRYRFRARI